MFNVGDVVTKEHWPKMTVEKTDAFSVYCVWFTGDDDRGWSIHRDIFYPGDLILIESNTTV